MYDCQTNLAWIHISGISSTFSVCAKPAPYLSSEFFATKHYVYLRQSNMLAGIPEKLAAKWKNCP
jgi:hypothetical protein